MSNAVTTSQRAAAQAIAEFLQSAIIAEAGQTRTGYGHMGATLTDTALQAGLSYRSVVLPRVNRILALYPDAKTTTSFRNLLCDVGPCELLQWSHPEKINRLTRLLELMGTKRLETESEVARWLCLPGAADELLAIKGIGPKTIDYLKILVGIPTVAVDRHVRYMFQLLGLEFTAYDECRLIVCEAAYLLQIDPGVLDGMIWQLVSTKSMAGRWRSTTRSQLRNKVASGGLLDGKTR